MKRLTVEQQVDYIDLDRFTYSTLDDFAASVAGLIVTHGPEVQLRFEESDGDQYLILFKQVPESDELYNRRITWAADYQTQRYQQYLELKKEFGDLPDDVV